MKKMRNGGTKPEAEKKGWQGEERERGEGMRNGDWAPLGTGEGHIGNGKRRQKKWGRQKEGGQKEQGRQKEGGKAGFLEYLL